MRSKFGTVTLSVAMALGVAATAFLGISTVQAAQSNVSSDHAASTSSRRAVPTTAAAWRPVGAGRNESDVMPWQSPGLWLEQKVYASDAAEGAQFGWAVALDGDTAMVGAMAAAVDPQWSSQGAVYVFGHSSDGWIQTQQLTHSDAEAMDTFGNAIAVEEGVAVIAAHQKMIDDQWGSGAAYVFAEVDGEWVEVQKLTPPAAVMGHKFGVAVAMSGGTLAITSHTGKRVYTFERQGSGLSWAPGQIIDAPPGPGGSYGLSISLNGDDMVVGAPTRPISGNSMHGSAFVYERVGGQWELRQELLPSDSNPSDMFYFGQSVAVDGDNILVGARLASVVGSPSSPGAAYMFERTGGVWTEVQKIAQGGDGQFGNWVDLQGDRALITAPYRGVGLHHWQGETMLYERDADGHWDVTETLRASDGIFEMQFGWMAALDGDRILVGAVRDQAAGHYAGSAYFYEKFNLYTISPSVIEGAGEIVADDGYEVAEGATPSFTLIPDQGYVVGAVAGTCGGSLSGLVYTVAPVTADCTIEVDFAPAQHAVSASVTDGQGSIFPAGVVTVEHGEVVAFDLMPAPGWNIANVEGSCTGTLAGSTFTTEPIVADCGVEAIFGVDYSDVIFQNGFEAPSN